VNFELAQSNPGLANAMVARGERLTLPEGRFNRVYILAASAGGDQTTAFEVGGKKVELSIQDWSGLIGQWDDRQWSKSGANDDYGEMVSLKPGYIKRADLAWYCSHHHDAAGENVPYGYSYLFAYSIDLPADATTIELPDNDRVYVLAISVAEASPKVTPAQALYDVLPPAATATSESGGPAVAHHGN